MMRHKAVTVLKNPTVLLSHARARVRNAKKNFMWGSVARSLFLYPGDEKAYRAYENKLLINIGAGGFEHPKWTNLDIETDWYARNHRKTPFVEYDITSHKPMPFEEGAVSLAYSSQVIEHVNDAAVRHLFAEEYRTLEDGAIFRVTCPNADLFYDACLYGRREYLEWREKWFRDRGCPAPEQLANEEFLIREVATERSYWMSSGGPGAKYRYADQNPLLITAAEVADRMRSMDKSSLLDDLVAPLEFDPKYPGYHTNCWNSEKITRFLREAGFSAVIASSFGSSLALPMRAIAKFDNSRPLMSVYVEAIK
jgi:SAM-dependent methyltransferase